MRYKDLPKTHPPITEGELKMKNLYQDLKLHERIQISKLSQQNQLLQREHLNLSPEDLKGSLEGMNEKWDKLIQQVEEVTKVTEAISLKCKEIIHLIDEHEKNKNE
jgi:hypothetical protein